MFKNFKQNNRVARRQLKLASLVVQNGPNTYACRIKVRKNSQVRKYFAPVSNYLIVLTRGSVLKCY